jgi:catechol 2,3-dioxygenase-like lactoylglutathione lyase family enzyme
MVIDHIYLPVSDLERSSEFYKKMLEPLGIDMPYNFGQLLGFAINTEPGFWLKNGEVAKDLYVAFTAKSADAVRASYKAARTDTTSRLPISLGSTNKRYEPSTQSWSLRQSNRLQH